MIQNQGNTAVFQSLIIEERETIERLRAELAAAETRLDVLLGYNQRFEGKNTVKATSLKTAVQTPISKAVRGGKPLSPKWVSIMTFISNKGSVLPQQVINYVHEQNLEINPAQVKWQLKDYVRKEWLEIVGGAYRIAPLGREKFNLPK